jgi:hypothetical protein
MKVHSVPLAKIMILFIVTGLCVGGFLKAQELMRVATTVNTVVQFYDYARGVAQFKSIYNAFPGDMCVAGTIIPGCTGAEGRDCNPSPASCGNGIIGDKNFAKTWKSQITGQTTVPAATAADETVLFWSHLCLSRVIECGLMGGIRNGTPVNWGKTNPAAKLRGGFIVGYSDGTPVPPSLAPAHSALKENVLLLVSTKALHGIVQLNEPDEQALTAREAMMMDRKADDGAANTGELQAYGAPRCFYAQARETAADKELRIKRDKGYKIIPVENNYNEVEEDTRDCALILRLDTAKERYVTEKPSKRSRHGK